MQYYAVESGTALRFLQAETLRGLIAANLYYSYRLGASTLPWRYARKTKPREKASGHVVVGNVLMVENRNLQTGYFRKWQEVYKKNGIMLLEAT